MLFAVNHTGTFLPFLVILTTGLGALAEERPVRSVARAPSLQLAVMPGYEMMVRSDLRSDLGNGADSHAMGNQAKLVIQGGHAWPGAGGRVWLLGRFDFGVGIPATAQSATCDSRGLDCGRSSFGAGVAAQWRLPPQLGPRLVPWGAVGLTYVSTRLDLASAPGLGSCPSGVETRLTGAGMELAVGVEHALSRLVSIGPYAQLSGTYLTGSAACRGTALPSMPVNQLGATLMLGLRTAFYM